MAGDSQSSTMAAGAPYLASWYDLAVSSCFIAAPAVFICSLGTLLLNKWLFQMLNFTFPLALTATHMLVSWSGAMTLILTGVWQRQSVKADYVITRVVPLSALFCVNIVLGNISLRFVPVSFMQTVKAAVPAFAIVFEWLFKGKRHLAEVYGSMVPIVGGVMLATYTEVNYHPVGFWAIVASCVCTAGIALISGLVLTQKLDPVNLLVYMAPTSFAILMPCIFMWELDGIRSNLQQRDDILRMSLLLFTSGVIALLLNLSTFFVIQKTSPLVYTIAGNLKVVLTIVVSVLIFRNEVTLLNAAGCAITVLGVIWYNNVELKQKLAEQRAKPPPDSPVSTSLLSGSAVLGGSSSSHNHHAHHLNSINSLSSSTSSSSTSSVLSGTTSAPLLGPVGLLSGTTLHASAVSQNILPAGPLLRRDAQL